MDARLRVAHVAMSLDTGGLERIVVDLVREGRRLGQEVAVVCLERPGKLSGQAVALGARVYCVDKRPGIRPGAFVRLRRVLRDFRPDVVHAHTVGGLFYAGPAARVLGAPLVVMTEHINNLCHPLSGRLARWRRAWLVWLSVRFCRRVFCVSKDIADELAERRLAPRDKLCVLLNGIDTSRVTRLTDRAGLRRSLGIPPEATVIGNVARLNPVKCQDLLIRAFARLKPRFPGAHLLLVGDGPSREALERQAAGSGLRGSVHFAGYQAEPERYLQVMNVFALTSSLEGLPLAILEAWAVGLPVVASAVGGVPDLIEHGRNGFLFPSGEEDALVNCLDSLLADPVTAAGVGDAARREAVARYDLSRMAGDYDRHYRELLGGRAGTGAPVLVRQTDGRRSVADTRD
jgi:glycosyltransferase involved in cell wall biosynthesis